MPSKKRPASDRWFSGWNRTLRIGRDLAEHAGKTIARVTPVRITIWSERNDDGEKVCVEDQAAGLVFTDGSRCIAATAKATLAEGYGELVLAGFLTAAEGRALDAARQQEAADDQARMRDARATDQVRQRDNEMAELRRLLGKYGDHSISSGA